MKRLKAFALLGALAVLGARAIAGSTAGASAVPVKSYSVRGIVAGPKGPLASRTVELMPIDQATGLGGTRYRRTADGSSESMNPKVQTDAKGAFTASVPSELFADDPKCTGRCIHLKSGALIVAVYPKAGDGPQDFLEPKEVSFDEHRSAVDLGTVTLAPMKP